MLEKIAENRLLEQLKKKDKTLRLVFFKTPFCGTCQLAERMLVIALKALSWPGEAYECTVEYAPDLVDRLQISSVPCFVLYENGILKEKQFAFRSVDHLYSVLKPYVA